MQLSPRYGDLPVLTLDGDPAAIREPLTRQLERFAGTLATLDDDQWSHPSRCEGWSSRDVIVHLETALGFWCYSLAEGLRGEPSRLLATFDPVASPAQMVAAASDIAPAEVLARFTATSSRLVDLVAGLDDADFTVIAEAPPGHLSVSAVLHHALWDAWVHERDVLAPLGVATPEEPDEVTACLRYSAVLSPAFAADQHPDRRGRLVVEATDPVAVFTIDVAGRAELRTLDDEAATGAAAAADAVFRGPAVVLTEAFSRRRPLPEPAPAPAAWLLDGLATVFDQTDG